MKRTKLFLGMLCIAAACGSCKKVTDLSSTGDFSKGSNLKINTTTPLDVKVKKNSSYSFNLTVNGANYFIKGAAVSNRIPDNYWTNASQYHANSIRIYNVDDSTQTILDDALSHNMTVTLCLYLAHPEFGFDYGDQTKVDSQYNAQIHWVDKYKNHPALLMWAIGNELNSSYAKQVNHLKCWAAVSKIATYIHLNDPHHPASTILAGSSTALLDTVDARATNLDCIGINEYGYSMANTKSNVLASTFDKPYYMGEYGPNGTWFHDAAKTTFGSLLEETSSEKANDYLTSYNNYIAPGENFVCLGSYAFLWSYLPPKAKGSTLGSQTFVPMWYGMRSFDNAAFGALEKLQEAWTGSYSGNKAPVIAASQMKWGTYTDASTGAIVSPSTRLLAKIPATDADGDVLQYEWSVVQEGAPLAAPAGVTTNDSKVYPSTLNSYCLLRPASALDTMTIRAPSLVGNYRLYGFVKDIGGHHVASACIPFKVQ